MRIKNISQTVKSKVNDFVGQFGYEVRRIPRSTTEKELTHFESCLHVLASMRETLNVVQVGANDGAINDPLYNFILDYPNRTRIILCEPQEYLIPELEKNYEFHPAKHIFNGAIGLSPSLTLYRIKRECWRDCSVPYAQGWPEYRAPTGITSSSYNHVLSWASSYYKGTLRLEETIETVQVDCIDVRELLKRSSLLETIDVLQIDAEGFDDQVIYASNIAEFLPAVVNFEYQNLPPQRAEQLKDFLVRQGYLFSQHGIDGLAIRTIRSPNEITNDGHNT